jgi:superfamily II DNA/RNA helicase
LTHIVLYDIPPTLTDYANRIGRTARMNSSGVSLLILNYQESDYVEQLKFYTPNINPIEKDTIFDKFKQILQKRGIQSETCYYIEGLVRGLVKDDP